MADSFWAREIEISDSVLRVDDLVDLVRWVLSQEETKRFADEL